MNDIILIAKGYIFGEILSTPLNDDFSNKESEYMDSDEVYQLFSSRDYDYE